MAAGKSQDLQSAIWRLGELVVQVLVYKPARQGPKKSQCFHLGQKAGKDPCPSSKKLGRRTSLLLTGGSDFLFYRDLQLLFVCLFVFTIYSSIFFKKNIEVQLIYNIVLVSAVQKIDSVLHIYIYIHFLILFSLMVCHKILNIIPCAIQQDLAVYPFYL